MKTKFILVLITGFLFSQNLFADSPLTSTPISQAYADSKIVQFASETDGCLTVELMNYLYESMHPIELKIAVINELGWGSMYNNASPFYEYLKEKDNFKNTDEFLNQASADILICMAYIKALEDYFDVDEAIIYAKAAKSKNSKSYTTNIICALIEAQNAMGSDWSQVYNLTNKVRQNQSLNRDMRDDAVKIIFEYMDLYKEG